MAAMTVHCITYCKCTAVAGCTVHYLFFTSKKLDFHLLLTVVALSSELWMSIFFLRTNQSQSEQCLWALDSDAEHVQQTVRQLSSQSNTQIFRS